MTQAKLVHKARIRKAALYAALQVLDFGGAGHVAASPTPKRTAPRLLNQRLWASVDSADSPDETPAGMAALQHSLALSGGREGSWEPSPFT